MPGNKEILRNIENRVESKNPESALLSAIKSQTLQDIITDDQEKLNFQLMEINRKIDFEEAIKSPKIFQLQRTWDPMVLLKLIVFIIKSFTLSVNVKNNMNNYQIMDTAYMFLQQYTHSSIKDLMLCFVNAKKGNYGIIYDRLDSHVLFTFIQQYEVEKARYLERKHQQFKDKEANNVNEIIYSLPSPIKEKVINSLPPNTINREWKRLKITIDKKRLKNRSKSNYSKR